MRPGIRPGCIAINQTHGTYENNFSAAGGRDRVAAAAQPQAGTTVPESRKQPHIILIVTDQQRGDALGCCNPAVLSPNLDALARDGVRFTRAYSSAPSSTPARAGLLTACRLGGMASGLRQSRRALSLRDAAAAARIGLLDAGYRQEHWTPQNATHGFHATLIDESGRRESPYFMSDYRKWFACHAPGLDPDATGIGWNAHRAAAYALPEELHPTCWTGGGRGGHRGLPLRNPSS